MKDTRKKSNAVISASDDTKPYLFIPGMSLKCFTHLCIVLKESMTCLSHCSASMVVRGSFIQLSCHFIQSEVVNQRFLKGSKSRTSLASLSY